MTHRPTVCALTFAALALLASQVAVPQATAQQASLGGSWSGGGTVTLASGTTERVRCRASFSPSGNGASMTATCANASARITQNADLTRVSATRYVGSFYNPEFNMSGSIRITFSGNSMSAALSGSGGSANISMSR